MLDSHSDLFVDTVSLLLFGSLIETDGQSESVNKNSESPNRGSKACFVINASLGRKAALKQTGLENDEPFMYETMGRLWFRILIRCVPV